MSDSIKAQQQWRVNFIAIGKEGGVDSVGFGSKCPEKMGDGTGEESRWRSGGGCQTLPAPEELCEGWRWVANQEQCASGEERKIYGRGDEV